jgi:hypothetical protein
MENHGGMISTGETPDSSTRFSVKPTSSHLVAKQEELAKKIMNLVLRSIFIHISNCCLTFREILPQRGDGFPYPTKEGVLRVLSPLKIQNPRPLTARTLLPMAITLTITPPRRTASNVKMISEFQYTWKEAVVAQFNVLFQHLHGGTENITENSVRLHGLQAEV